MLTVWAVHLDGRYTPGSQEAGEAHAEAAASLYPDSVQPPKAFGPGDELRVTGIGGRHGLASEAPAKPVQGDCDVRIGVCVDPQDDECLDDIGSVNG